MSFVLVSIAIHCALAVLVGQQIGASPDETAATAIHFVAAAIVNGALLWAVRKRRLALLASPAAAFLVMNQTYFTLSGLKYFDPLLITPQFGLDVWQRLAGSLAAEAVMLAGVGVLVLRGQRPSYEVVSRWLHRGWPDVRRLVVAALLVSVGAKLALVARGYGSLYSEAQFNTIVVRSYGDLALFLLSETATAVVLALGVVVVFGRGFGTVSIPLRILGAAAVVGELGYSLVFLKARLLLLTAAVFGLFAVHALRPRLGGRLLGLFLTGLPVLSLLGLQLTLAIGRTNIPNETGLRLGIAFVNSRADLTDFPTAILVNGGNAVQDPRIVAVAFLNAIPKAVFPGKEEVVTDVYSDILGRLGWPAGSGEGMVADYQDSVFSAGVMSGGYVGFAIVPLIAVWVLCELGRLAARFREPIVCLCALIGLSLASTHIEVEWATMVLNIRQGIFYAALLLLAVGVGRVMNHILVVACTPITLDPARARAALR